MLQENRETATPAIECWESSSEEEEQFQTSTEDKGCDNDEVNPLIAKMAHFICTFLLSWQAIFRLTDTALNVLFKFLSLLFLNLSLIMRSESLKMLYNVFPGNLKQARALKAIDTDRFTKFFMCEKWHTTYQYSDCIGPGGVNICKFIRFPRHPQKRMRLECSFPLLKTIKKTSGKLFSVPLRIFCYRSIIDAICTKTRYF